MDYLIKGATLVSDGETFRADVLVMDGLIAKIVRGGGAAFADGALTGDGAASADLSSHGLTVIDASGKYMIPGVIDEHVHFRDPGLTYKADVASESRAAVAGGVTSFMDMPNTVPQTTTQEFLQQKFDHAAEVSLANYSFYIGATNDNLSEVLRTDIGSVCGIKLFMGSSTGNMLVDSSEALETLFREAPCLIAAHCEDEAMIRRETARFREMAGKVEIAPNASIHPLVRSAEACYASSARAVELAAKTGAHLHVLHVSTARELELFRDDIPLTDKKITAETCPHYLCLDERDYETLGFRIKCNPAVKSLSDRMALLGALGSGRIDTIGSDHAPHLLEEKMTGDYFTSKSGFPSIQHTLELMLGLCCSGHGSSDLAGHGSPHLCGLDGAAAALALPDVVRLMCHNPASLYRIDRRGFLREGYHADLVLLDLDCERVLSDSDEFTKCGWTPYSGRKVRSKVTHTFVGGNLVYENGQFHDDVRGERLKFNR